MFTELLFQNADSTLQYIGRLSQRPKEPYNVILLFVIRVMY